MITIDQVGDKYNVLFSEPDTGTPGFSIQADSIKGLHAAIDHYFDQPHESSGCPLCEVRFVRTDDPEESEGEI